MRKSIVSLLAVMLFVTLLSGCSSAETNSKDVKENPVVVPKHQLYLDVEFESNLLLAIYDVDVYVDEEMVGNIPHGKNFTKLLEVDEGSHLIRFENEGDSTVTAEKKIDVKNDMTFKCTIKGHSDEIEFVDIELLDSIEGNSIKTENYLGRSLEAVTEELEANGFVNVNYHSKDESDSIWDTANWVIVEQNIEPGVELDKNSEIILTCEKIETYLDNHYLNLNISEAMSKAGELKHTLEFKNAVTRENFLTNPEEMTDEQKAEWIVNGTSDSRFAEGKVTLLLLYTGSKEVPSVNGMILNEALNILKAQDFSNVKAKSDDGSSIWNYANWTITSQSVEAGTVIKATDEITLTCHHNEEEKVSAERTSEAIPASEEDNVPGEYRSALKSAEFYSKFFHNSKAAIYDQLTSEYGDNVSAEAAQYAIDNVQADWNQNALKSAESYSETMHMSKAGIYDQLISKYGDQFTAEEAQYAIDNIQVDWNQNALKSAESYSESMHMSKAGIFDQLTSEYADQFTAEEAQYAVDNVQADWNENALESARSYLEMFEMSNEEIFDQLTSAYGDQFTAEQAQYAIEHLNG